jgi:hypothetical protein
MSHVSDDMDALIEQAVKAAMRAADFSCTQPLPSADTLLTREATSNALTRAGFRVAPKTLATMATRGGGPPYRRFSSRALYRWGDVLDWAQSRLSAPRRSTAEADAQSQGR